MDTASITIDFAEAMDAFQLACLEVTGTLHEFCVSLGGAIADALAIDTDPDAWLRSLPCIERERALRAYAAILNRGRSRRLSWRRLNRPQRRAALISYLASSARHNWPAAPE